MKKAFMWYCMLTKRLFKRYSFIVILLIIPIIIPIAQVTMGSGGSVMNIALYAKDEADENAKKVMESLLEQDSVIKYSICESEEEAYSKVQTQKADAAWIFDEDLERKAVEFGLKKAKKPFVTVVQREDNVSLKLSREKLYGAVFPLVSYGVFKNYVTEELLSGQNITEEQLKNYYDNAYEYSSIIEVKRLSSDEEMQAADSFLVMPLRGILAIIIMLSGLAAVMYYLEDVKAGRFDWLSPKKRIIPAFGMCFSAVFSAAVFVSAALVISGITVGLPREITAMLLLVFSATAFCLILCMLFKSAGTLGAFIPFMLIAMLILSPVFFNVKMLKAVRLLIPTQYYLYGIYDFKYCIGMIVYCVIAYFVAGVLNTVKNLK